MQPPAKPAASSPASLALPAAQPSAIRISGDSEMMASEFGRALLQRTAHLRNKAYVVVRDLIGRGSDGAPLSLLFRWWSMIMMS